jgi:hypothetical protein
MTAADILEKTFEWGRQYERDGYTMAPLDAEWTVAKAVKALQRVIEQEVIGEDEGNIPLESIQPDGMQLVHINPKDQLRATQRQALKELFNAN